MDKSPAETSQASGGQPRDGEGSSEQPVPFDEKTTATGPAERSRQNMDQEAGGIAATAKEKAGEYSKKAQETAAQVGEKVSSQADAGIDLAASGLQTAADEVRERLGEQGGMAGQVGTKMAGGLERTAGYLREHDSNQVWGDFEQFVKDHPMRAAAGAVVAGFLIGRILR
ncbi:MAG: hypothetical protein ACR2HN_08970 [Tepidiformaceae bacterium]